MSSKEDTKDEGDRACPTGTAHSETRAPSNGGVIDSARANAYVFIELGRAKERPLLGWRTHTQHDTVICVALCATSSPACSVQCPPEGTLSGALLLCVCVCVCRVQ